MGKNGDLVRKLEVVINDAGEFAELVEEGNYIPKEVMQRIHDNYNEAGFSTTRISSSRKYKELVYRALGEKKPEETFINREEVPIIREFQDEVRVECASQSQKLKKFSRNVVA